MLNWLKSHKLATALVLLASGGVFYWFISRSQVEYLSYTVESGSIRDTLELSGKVTADRLSTLRFPAGGLVTYLGAKEGDTVKKWQTLASLDTRQLQKTLEQKLNLYAMQRATFDQTVDDNDNSVPDGDLGRELTRLLAKNQYQLENTVKDVEYLDLSLQLSRLSSPLTGILVQSPIQTTGVNVLATDSWVVVDPTSLYFSADLDETDLRRVRVGQTVEITLDAYPDKQYESVISTIAYTPKETTTGTVYEIKLALPPAAHPDLRLGLNGTATIILAKKDDVALLPSSALSFEGGSSRVMIKNGDKYESRPVELGIENEGFVEITKGVSVNDQVYIEKPE